MHSLQQKELLFSFLFIQSFSPVCVFAPGLQAILPEYLRARFVQAALSYIGCNEEGQFVCRDNDCWCQCAAEHPQCNCPKLDLRAMEANLLQIRDSWNTANQDFEGSGQCSASFITNYDTQPHPHPRMQSRGHAVSFLFFN